MTSIEQVSFSGQTVKSSSTVPSPAQKRIQNNEGVRNKGNNSNNDQPPSMRVQKILENAKRYEGKKDYMMEGLKNAKKKP